MSFRRRSSLLAATTLIAATAAGPVLPASGAATKPVTKSSLKPVRYAKNLKREPIVLRQAGRAPVALIKKDLVVGKGRKATNGQNLEVQYTGYALSTGKKFDASWDRQAEPFAFPLGTGAVITGWEKGIPGMRVGGRRELVIPPRLAYGSTGSGSIAPGETLIFVVDLLKAER
ncbi:MAG: peptidylprolyl isomerase [Solirubrobacterales bacterium]|nr:peptidylprolyl isomerase [Solirubrobacterales bacterium]